MDILEISVRLMTFFGPFLFSLCFHEFAHGWVAKMRGDRTAEMSGRLTMNPIAHMDPIGTVLLPLLSIFFHSPISFGWAKPVPVNPRNLKNPRTDMFWVALAGPASNILLAIVGTVALVVMALFIHSAGAMKGVVTLLQSFIFVNLFLAFFNLIPLNPLDGGKILARFLPPSVNYKMEQHENLSGILLMILILSGAIRFLAIPVEVTYEFLVHSALGILS
jgi:Zn-dependent protease